ncbi:putative zinc metalloprotease [Phyllosticta citrichinensis]|uniref:Peptide hydrolase n=1 Tax=Phyllosticta citrichinensis TaxID=1130410 RepID=A0ABR1XGB3_9PEZI
MARLRLGNPLAFTPLPVIFWTCLIYIAIAAGLLYVHHVVPSAPAREAPVPGINLTESWRDLQYLSNGFHPYNSRRNDQVRNWLLTRIEAILNRNNVSFVTDQTSGSVDGAPVVLYNDMTSNVTFSSRTTSIYFEGTNIMVYIRGAEDIPGHVEDSSTGGVLVNAHYDSVSTGFGATDDGVGVISILQLISYFTTPGNQPKRGIVALLNNGEEDWLNGAKAFTEHPLSYFPHTFLNLEGAGAGGRATLFRSTDTEVTRFYQKSKHPFGSVISADGFKRGIIRSGTDYSIFTEDMGLRGLDVAFMEPRAKYHTVEDGARDTSLDSVWHMLSGALETTKGLTSYTGEEFEGGPDGTGDGSSGVWFDLFGSAFAVFQLHTLFALSVALLVVAPLVLIGVTAALARSDKWYLFARKKYLHSSDDDEAYPLYGWRGFFRFPVAIVVATAAVVGLTYLVAKINPAVAYSSQYAVWSMMLTAWFCIAWFVLRGGAAMRPSALTRAYGILWMYILFYILLVAATVATNNYDIAGVYFILIYSFAISLALLISYLELFILPKKKTHVQMIADYGYEGSSQGGDNRRTQTPSSSRPLTAATAVTDHPPQHKGRDDRRNSGDDDATEATSLLRGDRQTTFARGYGSRHGSRRASIDARSALSIPTSRAGNGQSNGSIPTPAFPREQSWSGYLPRWTWLLQLLILGPINIILVGQLGLLQTSALHQTIADGSSALLVYLMIAVFSAFLLLPVLPFLHRFTAHVPAFLFVICMASLLYNLLALPFSPNNRLKVYFIQRVDLDSGRNEVSLTGLDEYVQQVVKQLPSTSGQEVKCGPPDAANRAGLVKCAWQGLMPEVVPRKSNTSTGANDVATYPSNDLKFLSTWVHVNASRDNPDDTAATIAISGLNTRSCRLFFDSAPATALSVRGASTSGRFDHVDKAAGGTREARLWSREWDREWIVDVEWDGTNGDEDADDGEGERCKGRRCPGRGRSGRHRWTQDVDVDADAAGAVAGHAGELLLAKRSVVEDGHEEDVEDDNDDNTIAPSNALDGRAVCIWSDANAPGTIPALDEVRAMAPTWAIVSKLADGLVEGSKRFVV